MSNLHDQAIRYLDDFNRKVQERHKERMAEWDKFKTDEYQEGVRQYLLEHTHADVTPPWLNTDTTEQSESQTPKELE